MRQHSEGKINRAMRFDGSKPLHTIRSAGVILLSLLSPALFWAQSISGPEPNTAEHAKHIQLSPSTEAPAFQTGPQTNPQTEPAAAPDQSPDDAEKQDSSGKQTKRILGMAPNFAAVSAGERLQPLTAKGKFKLASADSFDYSAFVWVGILSVQSMGLRAYPEFGHGMAGYSRYYWHEFVDSVSGTYFTEAIVPVIRHEDPRYYTMEHGGFFRRMGYALSRVAVTRTDSGGTSFNFSELGGNAMEAGLANLYYPVEERGPRKTLENWGAQIESAALNNIFKEFWPDIRQHLFRMK